MSKSSKLATKVSLMSAGGVKLSSNCGLKSFVGTVCIFSGLSSMALGVDKPDSVTPGKGFSFSVFVAGSTCIC